MQAEPHEQRERNHMIIQLIIAALHQELRQSEPSHRRLSGSTNLFKNMVSSIAIVLFVTARIIVLINALCRRRF